MSEETISRNLLAKMLHCIFLLLHIIIVESQAELGNLYIKTNNLSLSTWSSLGQSTVNVQSVIECGSLCLQKYTHDLTCNAFKFEDGICEIVLLTQLEDQQENVESAIFHIDEDVAKTLPMICYGSLHCCRPENQCPDYHGDCNTDDDCLGNLGHYCGNNNCNKNGGNWDAEDDCCYRRCTPDTPCQIGQGHCENSNDCVDPSWQSCVNNNCLRSDHFPIASFPLNVADNYLATDNCCVRACRPDSRCGHGKRGCEHNNDCSNGHACQIDTKTCLDINECANGNGICDNGSSECVNTIGSFYCIGKVLEIEISTGCSQHDNTQDEMQATICQGSNCCSTKKLKDFKKNCQVTKIDGGDLNNCTNFEINMGGSVNAKLELFGKDRWTGEYIKIVTHLGAVWQCDINRRLDEHINWVLEVACQK